jgi:hypothetical protein
MMPDTLTKLENVIQSNPYDVKQGPSLFYNEKGPNKGGAEGGEIYIDCQPVGESEDTIDVINNTGNYGTMNFSDWLKNPIVKLILGSLLFIIILFIVKYGLNLLKPIKRLSIMNGGKRN